MASSTIQSPQGQPSSDEPECPVCYEVISIADRQFDEESREVIYGKLICEFAAQHGTNHDLCKECSEHWFHANPYNPHCPICRTPISHLNSPVVIPEFPGPDGQQRPPGNGTIWGQHLTRTQIRAAVSNQVFSQSQTWRDYPSVRHEHSNHLPYLNDLDAQQHALQVRFLNVHLAAIVRQPLVEVSDISDAPENSITATNYSTINSNLVPDANGRCYRLEFFSMALAEGDEDYASVLCPVEIDITLSDPVPANFSAHAGLSIFDPPEAHTPHMVLIMSVRSPIIFGNTAQTFTIACTLDQPENQSLAESIGLWLQHTQFCRCVLPEDGTLEGSLANSLQGSDHGSLEDFLDGILDGMETGDPFSQ
jgi:hypothetical protein